MESPAVIKARMKHLNVKQVDMIKYLRRYGIVCSPSQLSYTLSGVTNYRKDQQILEAAELILKDISDVNRKTNLAIS